MSQLKLRQSEIVTPVSAISIIVANYKGVTTNVVSLILDLFPGIGKKTSLERCLGNKHSFNIHVQTVSMCGGCDRFIEFSVFPCSLYITNGRKQRP